MSTRDDLPPGPYTFETITAKGRPEGTGHIYLLDATGRKIASMWGTPKEKVALANLICDARENDIPIKPSNLDSAIAQFSGRVCSDCPIPEIRMAAELDAAKPK